MKLHLEGVRLERNPGLYGRFIGGFPSEDIRLRVVETGEISPRPEKPIFEMPGHWRLHSENGQRLFEICDPLTARPNRVAEMDAGLKEGVIRLGTEGQRDLFGRPQSKRPRRRNLATILEPLLRILLADRLGTEDGLMLFMPLPLTWGAAASSLRAPRGRARAHSPASSQRIARTRLSSGTNTPSFESGTGRGRSTAPPGPVPLSRSPRGASR